jgi:hypothetical protein
LNKSWYNRYQRVHLSLLFFWHAGNDYTKIYSTDSAFAALKADGSIKVWGSPSSGGTGAPAGNDYTKIYSTASAFAALKADGSIKVWGDSGSGGTDAPAGSGYTKIYSNWQAFAVIKTDGSPESESPHAAIEPSVLRAAKAPPVE